MQRCWPRPGIRSPASGQPDAGARPAALLCTGGPGGGRARPRGCRQSKAVALCGPWTQPPVSGASARGPPNLAGHRRAGAHCQIGDKMKHSACSAWPVTHPHPSRTHTPQATAELGRATAGGLGETAGLMAEGARQAAADAAAYARDTAASAGARPAVGRCWVVLGWARSEVWGSECCCGRCCPGAGIDSPRPRSRTPFAPPAFLPPCATRSGGHQAGGPGRQGGRDRGEGLQLGGWLAGRLGGWLIGWLAGRLAGWLAGWLAG